jgi:hypothetical protein
MTAIPVVAAPQARPRTLLAVVLLAQLPIMLLVGYLSTRNVPLVWLWAAVGISMMVFVMVLGESKGRIGGILITNHNVMSLSRFQVIAWTLLICSAFITIALARVFASLPTALTITIPNELWQLLGISGASTVGAAMIMQNKTNKQPAPQEVTRAAASLKAPAPEVAEQADGLAYANGDPKDAHFTDMFEGDEIMNAAYIDVSKVQMFFFTLVALIGYGALIAQFMMNRKIEALTAFPEVSSGLVTILGISHATYLGTKTIDQTKTA